MRLLKGLAAILFLVFVMVVLLPPLASGINAIGNALTNNPGISAAILLVPALLYFTAIALMAFVVFLLWGRRNP